MTAKRTQFAMHFASVQDASSKYHPNGHHCPAGPVLDLNAKTLYRALSARGNPEMKNLMAILKAMGMRSAVVSIEAAHV